MISQVFRSVKQHNLLTLNLNSNIMDIQSEDCGDMLVGREHLNQNKDQLFDLFVEREQGNQNKAHTEEMPRFTGHLVLYRGHSMDIKLVFLGDEFFRDYADCPEIEKKPNRPHLRMLMEINGLTFAIPFRSHISHPHSFITDKENSCGLDYSKAVILKDPERYIEKTKTPRLRQNEFNALKGKTHIIETGMLRYIKAYKKALLRPDIQRNALLLKYSTLQYFPDLELLPEK